MFKYIKTQLILVLFTLVLVISCMEDKGNYNYKEINEVKVEGLKEEYSVVRFDNFNIVPRIVNTKKNNNSAGYSYKWQTYDSNSIGDEVKLIDLSTEKDLLTPIQLKPGNYNIYYTIKDLDTELEFQYNFRLEVVNSIYEGWLVLSEVNGGSRLDMVSLINGKYETKIDVLGLSSSELKLKGKPGFVYTYKYKRDYYGIYISTSGNGTVKIEPNTFSWNSALNISNEFVGSQPLDLEVDNLVAKYNGHAYIAKNGNIYYYFDTYQLKYSAPINTIGGVVFEASPFIGKGYLFGNSILYDNTNKRFVNTNYGKTSVMPAGTLFNFTTGKDLEYMVGSEFNGSYGAEIFSILKDSNNGKKYLAIFNSQNNSQSYYGEVIAPDFNKATSYAVSPDYGYLFYVAGSKVYQYDFSLRTTKLMLDKGSEEISLIKFHNFFEDFLNDDYKSMQSKLIVCSYNGSEGTMELYKVPPVNGQIKLETKYSGFGKIKSITYRER
ncbi:PKD-like family lipoprotein [Polaribacter cellanae]|uniref:PKD-like family protein n=1 Tax=Polaribacter cellanae TaxID=2818493 RepID=A0A975CP76_9FLAO|nr:PKD-like family lipoprotein [Polaribacter cellanae]QTE21327.1 hypothetical protein J3359_10850 [Polaribacter cellanae]